MLPLARVPVRSHCCDQKSWEEKVKEAEEAAAERAKNLAKLGVLNAGASKEEIAAKRTTVCIGAFLSTLPPCPV